MIGSPCIKASLATVLCIGICLTGEASANLLRMGFWNTFNNPDTETEDSNFSIIFTALPQIDLWGAAETDTDSSLRMNSVLTSTTGFTWNYITGGSVGGDRTGIFWNTSTLTLLSSGQFESGFTRPVTWGTFRPVGTTGAADFAYISNHFKSGSTSSDETIRASESTQLVNALATINLATVILAGDFNWLTATEPAYQNLSNAGYNDLAGRPGDWRGNPDFIDLHTQDPRLNLDDRFDMMLGNSYLSDGLGLDYVPGSFDVFGNDGTHTVGSALTENSEANSTTLAALFASSDHLPIYATFVVVPEPGSSVLVMMPIVVCLLRRRRNC